MTRPQRARTPTAEPIPGRWNGADWVGPIGPGVISQIAAMKAGGCTYTAMARELSIPYAAARWFCARPDVLEESRRLLDASVRARRLLAMGVLTDVALDADNAPGARVQAAGAILQHSPAAAGDPAEVDDDQLAEWLVGERDSGRLAVLLRRGDELAAARIAAESGALASPAKV